MTTIIIFAIIGVFLMVRKLDKWYDLSDKIFLGVIGAFAGAVCGFVLAVVIPSEIKPTEYQLSLTSLQDGQSISGSFFLGSGHIDGKMKYVFYYQDGDFYKMTQLDANRVRIKYSDSSPVVRVLEEEKTGSFINYFTVHLYEPEYIIQVPEGTIKSNFNLDAH